MQDKEQVENKSMSAPAAETKTEPKKTAAEQDAIDRKKQSEELFQRFRKLKPPEEAWIVVLDNGLREEPIKSVTVGSLNIVCDKPTKLDRRRIEKVQAYVAAQGTRLKFMELPESWKGWK